MTRFAVFLPLLAALWAAPATAQRAGYNLERDACVEILAEALRLRNDNNERAYALTQSINRSLFAEEAGPHLDAFWSEYGDALERLEAALSDLCRDKL